MHATLTTAYSDTRADALGWRLGLPTLPALASRALRVNGVDLELRLLGASHQVVLDPRPGEADQESETIACLPGSAAPLPSRTATRLGRWSYEFMTLTQTFDTADEFDERAREVIAYTSAHPHGLIGDYPGLPYAVTALTVGPYGNGVSWSTWHTYPQERRIVSTRSHAM